MEHFGEKMELLKFSKFKLQLRTLITEVRELRVRISSSSTPLSLYLSLIGFLVNTHFQEKDRSATEQLRLLIQKQKQTEEEYGRKLQESQAELASSNELRQKLEREVRYLQNDNSMLENKQKELKGTIQSLLQSRDTFVNAYEESTCEMKRSIQCRDRKLSVLSEKIKYHLLLFDSIEKEAMSVKKVVDNVQRIVSEKEEVVAGLKSKLDTVSTFEKVFIERICDLESKLNNYEGETRGKDRVISELEAQMEAAKICNNSQTQIEELQKIISSRDVVIQNLMSEKQALHFEVGSLGIILRKIQDTVRSMNEEDKGVISSMLERQGGCNMILTKEDNRIEDVNNNAEMSQEKAYGTGVGGNTSFSCSPISQKYKSAGNDLQENNNFDSCVSEASEFYRL
ncbi:PREDICTED: LOW QUALITY PROTEIN: spindle pole body component 110 [Prunus mume]|uniref:LOW QUALITY PROTEIN: spindle pole body component 110 n=1 Tax=Prunus mume TaxID=102107 RepID=A0ABM0NA88_PRUMU|nr:PREDICTED: LOW QUALITY PROTEIN: spindle pole body component 110 [Prunus mume]